MKYKIDIHDLDEKNKFVDFVFLKVPCFLTINNINIFSIIFCSASNIGGAWDSAKKYI